MEEQDKHTNQWMLIVAVAILFACLIQTVVPLIPVRPLQGSYTLAGKPELSANSWFDESFQQGAESWLNDHFGFRNWFVRLDHQVAFSLFRKSYAEGGVVGKSKYLYEAYYINAYYGDDFRGIMPWEETLGKLTAVDDTLRKLGKHLLIVIAPNKAACYSDCLPYDPRRQADSVLFQSEAEIPNSSGTSRRRESHGIQRNMTNYDFFTKRLAEEHLDVIDFYKSFNGFREASPYPLFAKTGIHWSEWGQFLATDSILRYVDSEYGFRMPRVRLDSIVLSKRPNAQDADIERAMNLFFPVTREELAYPVFHFEEDSVFKPKGFVVGDSFYWQLMGDGSNKALFDNGEFWYYNQEINDNAGKMTPQNPERAAKKFDESDLIIIMCTDAQLSRFGWGVVEDLYNHWFTGHRYAPVMQAEIDKALYAMRQDSSWMSQISKKAEAKGISIDSMMLLDAIYIYEQRNKK